jgi:uroporphyrinogen decarboxylase
MTSRERVLTALDHKTTDRVPLAMVCSGINPPAKAELDKFLKKERGISVDEYLRPLIDITGIGPEYIGPSLEERTDIWGVCRAPVSYGSGAYDEIEYYPLAGVGDVTELDAYPWPDPDMFEYSGIPAAVDRERAGADRCLMVANGNIFESSWYMRGFERFFFDLVDNPELAEGIMDRVLAFYLEYFDRILTAGRGEIDLVFTADDLGGQQGLLMSREMWEHFIKPRHRKLNALIHSHGAKVIYHSDGAVLEVVDGLMDAGIDILQALQLDAAGMDAEVLKRRFGETLCFEGGVSVQQVLPFGTADEVREEVRRLIRILGRDGGYILGPSHAIQAGTPPENILAMFDTAAEYYPFDAKE